MAVAVKASGSKICYWFNGGYKCFVFSSRVKRYCQVGADPLNALKRGIPNYRRINQLGTNAIEF